MSECSICGLVMIREGMDYLDGQLVACADGHVAQVSIDCDDLHLRNAEPASKWVARLRHAFPDRGRRRDTRTLAGAVRDLERDARLGAAVRAAVERMDGDRIDEREVLASIARVLREEGSDG